MRHVDPDQLADPTTAPAAPSVGASGEAMTKIVAMKGMAGVEHVQASGSFVAYLPLEPVPPSIRAGDRLRVRLEVADDTWLYAVSEIGRADYAQLGVWPPGNQATPGFRMLWPGGHVLTADEATMMTLFVIASREELPWARDLTRTDCSILLGKMPPEPPSTACDHLYGLSWKVPRRPRGMIPHKIEFFQDGGIEIPAIVAAHSDAPYTALEWQFLSRE
jgi:hypothetical protein